MTLASRFASTLQARINCKASGNDEWLAKHTASLHALLEFMPSGSGVDNGTTIDLDRSKPNRLVFHTSFHHMSEHGMYAGWTDHTVTVTPDFVSGVDVTVSGRDRNDIKSHLADLFRDALLQEPAFPGR